jgi:hypothetical protein
MTIPGETGRQMNSAVSWALRNLQQFGVEQEGSRTAADVLFELWRHGYAAGTRDEKSAENKIRRAQPPGAVRAAMSGAQAEAAAEEGWEWGTGLGLKPGQAFRFGGCDTGRPTVDRHAVVSSVAPHLRMCLSDTGERVRVPVMFWMNTEGAEDDNGPAAA